MGTDFRIVHLRFQPPYDGDAFLRFLEMRCIEGVDRVVDSKYRRVVRFGEQLGWVQLGFGKESLAVHISNNLEAAMPGILETVQHFADLHCDPAQVNQRLGALSQQNPGLRVPGAFDGFEIALRAVVGQQISVKAARTLLRRLAVRYGIGVEFERDSGLTTAFPQAADVANAPVAEIASLGMPRARAQAVSAIARAVADGFVHLEPGAPVPETMDRLRELPGIGEWTAQYIAMRALRWLDAFPHTDLVLRKALGENNPRRILQLAEAWRPWRSYALLHLWSRAAA